MPSQQWVKDFIYKNAPKTPDHLIEQRYERVLEPNIGDSIFFENENGILQKIKIVSGQFLDSTYGRLSNFWYWNEVDEQGTESSQVYNGYGNFFINSDQLE